MLLAHFVNDEDNCGKAMPRTQMAAKLRAGWAIGDWGRFRENGGGISRYG
jgi:hypothetical protein